MPLVPAPPRTQRWMKNQDPGLPVEQGLEVGEGAHPPEEVEIGEQVGLHPRVHRLHVRTRRGEGVGDEADGGGDLGVDGHPAAGVEEDAHAQPGDVEV